MITKQLHENVLNKVHSIMSKFIEGYNKNITVVYRRDLKRIAGRANLTKGIIEINEILFLENVDTFFEKTIPHECAHHIVSKLYPKAKQYHGPEFRYIMNSLGCDASTYHSYDVSSVSTSKTYQYSCGCDKKLNLTKLIHNKVQNGQKRHCRKCKQDIKFVG